MRKRASATAIGRAGEEAAAAYLAGLGYRVLERNVRFRSGEIDLVAEKDRVLVFVEVKTRTGPGFGSASEAVTPRKQQQVVRLARCYLATRGIEDRPCRFDVVAVEPAPGGGWACTLIVDAFCAG